jgi:two-component system, chemotaxis family, response regulator Rcp1
MTTNILLVEDNPVDAELITEAFREACDCVCAPLIQTISDGEGALQFLRGMDKPGFMLLDLNLPKKGGLEILKELRVDPDPVLNMLPVIILTNSNTAQDVRRAYKHRCNAFVRKPIGYENIVEMARKLSQFWCQCAILPNRASSPPPSS